MKKLFSGLLFMICISNFGIAQELSTNAKMIKEKFNYEYENNFKIFAVKEWKDDLGLMSKDDYEILKEKLSKIILKLK